MEPSNDTVRGTTIIPNTSNVEILTPDGFEPFSALSVTAPEDGLRFEFEDGTTVATSPGHLFVTGGRTVLASTLSVGDSLDTATGSERIAGIVRVPSRVHVGPLNVRGHVYATPDGLSHHNCQFIGSSTTLISPDALDKLTYVDPVTTKYGYAMNIFEEPVPDAFYVMGVDSAAGSGKDYSVIQVLRVHERGKYDQVAVYADNNTPPGRFATIVKEVAEWYNNALSIVENNEIGKTVADEAWYTLGYDGIINTDPKGIGTRATKTSKLDACVALKKFMEEGQLAIHDRTTIHELTIFEEVAPNIFKAPRNKHDDRVSALYWACYALTQPEIDLDNLSANQRYKEETPQTFWGDSTDMEDSSDFDWMRGSLIGW